MSKAEIKTYRVKKDVRFYHPMHITLLKGSTFRAYGKRGFILVRYDNMIMTDEKEIKEYVEEI